MRKLILFLLFLGWNYPPPAVGAAPPAQMVFKHLGISEGFNQTNVTTLYQDENGTIWAADCRPRSRSCRSVPRNSSAR